MSKNTSVLFVTTGPLGDNILSSAIVKYVLDNTKNPKLTLVTSANIRSLYAGLPVVHELILPRAKYTKKDWVRIVWFSLKYGPYQIVIDCKASGILRLLPGKYYTMPRPKNPNKHYIDIIQNYLQTPVAPYIWTTEKDKAIVKTLQPKFPYITIVVLAGYPVRSLSIPRAQQLTHALYKAFPSHTLAFIAAPNQINTYKTIVQGIPHTTIVQGLTLPQIMLYIQGADVFVGPDTGTIHVAAVSQTPLVGLYIPKEKMKIHYPYTGNKTILIAEKTHIPHPLDNLSNECIIQAIRKYIPTQEE